MTETYHYFWALLPLILVVMTTKGYWKKSFKGGLREYPTESLKQFVYCLVLLVLAVAFDNYAFDDIADKVGFEMDTRIPRWLIYPAFLSIAAAIQNFFTSERSDAEKKAMSDRQRRYTERGF